MNKLVQLPQNSEWWN